MTPELELQIGVMAVGIGAFERRCNVVGMHVEMRVCGLD
jgi:hypothetical protein